MDTKLKLFITVIAMTCLLAIDAGAQNMLARSGIKGGLNVSNLYSNAVDDENTRYGFNVGEFGSVLSGASCALQPELLYSIKGAEATYGGLFGNQKTRFNFNYLEMPVLAVFKLGSAAEIHAGGYAGYLLHANMRHEGGFVNTTQELNRDNFKSGDAGLVGGFALNFGNTQIGARYNYGMVEIADSNAARNLLGNSKNSSASLYVALNLNR